MKKSKTKDKIKRFIECYLPVTACNLYCSYCYVIQGNRRMSEMPSWKYSPEDIAAALSTERLGGKCLISICGGGETLIPQQLIKIIELLLKNGHYINITTNGTLTDRFKELLDLPSHLLDRLHFSFSLHYIELVNKNLLETFFSNVKMVKQAGCSILVQFNLVDEYLPYLEEIKDICLKEVKALPQIALTRYEKDFPDIKVLSILSAKEYLAVAKEFKSPLFEFTNKNFMIKRNEFCYAGDWSCTLDLSNGQMRKCYLDTESFDIFKDPKTPINFEAIGIHCKSPYCYNSSHFMALGTIPEIKCPSYAKLRNRKCSDGSYWMTEAVKQFTNSKLAKNNKQYIYKSKQKQNSMYSKFRKLKSVLKIYI